MLSRNDALSRAQAEAAAANASVKKNIGILDNYETQNQSDFNANIGNYAPDVQAKLLQTAQDTRGNNNVANITTPDQQTPVPIQADASPATRSDLAKRMQTVYDQATARAKAIGKLGGYSDQWVANNIGNQQTADKIGVTNNMAEARKALIQPEAELASQGAYRAPSIWGPLLQGAGSIMSGAAGARGFGGGTPAPVTTTGLDFGVPASSPYANYPEL